MADPASVLIDAIIEHLRAEIPALASSLGLPDVLEYLDYEPERGKAPSKAPQIWVDENDGSADSDTRRGASVMSYAHVYPISVGVTVAAPDPSTAHRWMRGYRHVIRQCLEASQTMGGQSDWVRFQSYTRSSFREGTALYLEAVLTFDMQQLIRFRRD